MGTPEEILAALAIDGFRECTRKLTASPGDGGPAGGAWHGVNPRMKSVASVNWMIRPAAAPAMVFIEIDGQPITSPARDPDEAEGVGLRLSGMNVTV